MKREIKYIIIILLLNTLLNSEVNDGLVLISDYTDESVVLIDVDNNIVNSWEISDYNLVFNWDDGDGCFWCRDSNII